MSFKKIVEGREKLNEIKFWEMALIKYKHPKNSPSHFACYTVNFTDPNELKELAITMYDNFIRLIEKNLIRKFNRILVFLQKSVLIKFQWLVK